MPLLFFLRRNRRPSSEALQQKHKHLIRENEAAAANANAAAAGHTAGHPGSHTASTGTAGTGHTGSQSHTGGTGVVGNNISSIPPILDSPACSPTDSWTSWTRTDTQHSGGKRGIGQRGGGQRGGGKGGKGHANWLLWVLESRGKVCFLAIRFMLKIVLVIRDAGVEVVVAKKEIYFLSVCLLILISRPVVNSPQTDTIFLQTLPPHQSAQFSYKRVFFSQ